MLIRFLGTGASAGVPIPLCPCSTCHSQHPRNHRMRSSVHIQTPASSLLIDTPPELRLQMLRANTSCVDAVLYTHLHSDHVAGIDDLKPFSPPQKLPVYLRENFLSVLNDRYNFLLDPHSPYASLKTTGLQAYQKILIGDLEIQEIPIYHGPLMISAFKINQMAYITDCSSIPPESIPYLSNIPLLIFGMLHKDQEHPLHLNLKQILYYQELLQPQQILLTHLSHTIDYEETQNYLEKYHLSSCIQCAYDGLSWRVGAKETQKEKNKL